MAILKFKVSVDDLEGVSRELEIRTNQNYRHLHEALAQYFDMGTGKPASFFFSNTKWQKLKEVYLNYVSDLDTSLDGDEHTLQTIVDNKVNRMIYFNEKKPKYNFLIELKGISDVVDKKKKYPKLLRSEGSLTAASSVFGDDLFEESMNSDDFPGEGFEEEL